MSKIRNAAAGIAHYSATFRRVRSAGSHRTPSLKPASMSYRYPRQRPPDYILLAILVAVGFAIILGLIAFFTS